MHNTTAYSVRIDTYLCNLYLLFMSFANLPLGKSDYIFLFFEKNKKVNYQTLTFAFAYIWKNHKPSNIQHPCLTHRVRLLPFAALVSALSRCDWAVALVSSMKFCNFDNCSLKGLSVNSPKIQHAAHWGLKTCNDVEPIDQEHILEKQLWRVICMFEMV